MQNGTSEELYVVVYHVPFHIVSAGNPMVAVDGLVVFYSYKVFCRSQFAVEVIGRHHNLIVLSETSCCILHDAECNRQYLIENHFVFVKHHFFQFVYLVEDVFSFVDRSIFHSSFKFSNLCFFFFNGILQLLLQLFCACSQLVVSESFDFRVCSLHLFYDRLDVLHIAC